MIEAMEGRRMLSAVLEEGTLSVLGSEAADKIVIRKSGPWLRFAVRGEKYTFKVAKVKSVMVSAGVGKDVVDLRALDVPATVYGGAGDDVIYGGRADDALSGSTGHDRIFGRGGDDLLTGGVGDDSLFGGNGADAQPRNDADRAKSVTAVEVFPFPWLYVIPGALMQGSLFRATPTPLSYWSGAGSLANAGSLSIANPSGGVVSLSGGTRLGSTINLGSSAVVGSLTVAGAGLTKTGAGTIVTGLFSTGILNIAEPATRDGSVIEGSGVLFAPGDSLLRLDEPQSINSEPAAAVVDGDAAAAVQGD